MKWFTESSSFEVGSYPDFLKTCNDQVSAAFPTAAAAVRSSEDNLLIVILSGE
jgi:hypothetical protein